MQSVNSFNTFGESRREEILSALNGKLDAQFVKKRKQANFELSYVEGWHVIAEANRIFGADNWNMFFDWSKCVFEEKSKDTITKYGKETVQVRWRVSYIAQCRIEVAGVTRVDIGSGNGIDPDSGRAHESAVKEAYTDAMKRAFRTFGNPFGLALYDKLQENVSEDPIELLISDAMLFEKAVLDNVKSGRITNLGLRALLKIAGNVSRASEIKESKRRGILDLINQDDKVKYLNQGMNSKGEAIVEELPPVKPLEELEKEALEIMPNAE